MVSAPPKPRPLLGRPPRPANARSSRSGWRRFFPTRLNRFGSLESQLLAQIGGWGYDEIILPTFEYLDVLAPGLEAGADRDVLSVRRSHDGPDAVVAARCHSTDCRTVAMGLTGATLPCGFPTGRRSFATNRSMRAEDEKFFRSERN